MAPGDRAFTAADLRPVDLFDSLDDEQLEAWAAVSRPLEFATDELVAEVDKPPIGFMLLLEGRVQTLVAEGDRLDPIGYQVAPTWMFAIAVLTGMETRVTMRAVEPCRFAVIDEQDFMQLVFDNRDVHRLIMRQVLPVVSRITAIEQERERLASLGTMAAGLAHELNNPAAAARRAAAELGEAIATVSATIRRFVEAGVNYEQAEALAGLQAEALERATAHPSANTLEAADAEEEMIERLEDLGISEAWRIAEPLAAAGIDAEWLDRVNAVAGERATDPAVHWVAATISAQRLSAEIGDATERLSELVMAIKTYSYMDRGGLVEVDLHEGIDTTLTILGHKLKHTEIKVERDYDRSLPKLVVRGSELNQVWTNLIDNAIDALGERGTIAIRTRAEGECAVIEVADDGPGISEDVKGRVFEPFFTTKRAGDGSGLGLETAQRIVVQRHDGSIDVDSEPGNTVFRVSLPFDQKNT